ncbi:MAG TPA: endonuclease/exonuclease/phosphatase family protein [Pyrinomonadaceae bacterium]|jgi:endonuclease/exonuclease/phosphatase family metal-dependent hydrolase
MTPTAQPERRDRPAAGPEVERGEFAPPAPAAAGEGRLVVVTYNIRYAVGSHLIGGSLLRRVGLGWPGRRPRLVGSNIRRAARVLSEGSRMPPADVVALQEADRGTVRAGGRHVARELAGELGMNYVRAHTPTPADAEPKDRRWWLDFEERMLLGEEGDTGVALLSRLPLSGARRIELPWEVCPWRPRLAVSARVPFGGRRLHVFNSHIDTHAAVEGQLAQHRAVLALADGVEDGDAVVLLGDFNTLDEGARRAARGLLEARGYQTPMPTNTPTWRSGFIRHHFDWVFVRGARVTRWGVARVRGVSDHWPVWVELERVGGGGTALRGAGVGGEL